MVKQRSGHGFYPCKIDRSGTGFGMVERSTAVRLVLCCAHQRSGDVRYTGNFSSAKKKTIYPEWNKCFDTHLYDGRVITIVVLQKPGGKVVADVSIGVQFLVDQCKRDAHGFSSVWVGLSCIFDSQTFSL